MSGGIERTGLPASLDAERLVLGSILQDDGAFAAAAGLCLEDFSLEKHRRIWRRVCDLQARGEAVDYVTVGNELQRHGELESCDGVGYLVSLNDGLPHILNLGSYVRILQEKAALRKVIFACRNLASRCTLAGENSAEIVQTARDLFAGIGAGYQGALGVSDLPGVSEAGPAAIEYVREPELPRGAIVAVTGDAGSGKSTLVSAWVRDAVARGIPALILDRENPRATVVERNQRIGLEDGPLYRHWGGWCEQEAPQPDTPAVVDWVRLSDPKPVVVVDSFSAFGPMDQNDAGETRAFMHRCRRLADLGATITVIHHDGKAETARDYRGSSDFKAAIDQGFHVSNFGADGRLDRLVLRCFKSRVGFAGELSYRYADGQFIRGDSHDATETVSEQLTSILRQNPGIGARRFDELAAERGLGRNRARTWLSDGVLAGSIRFETGSQNARRYFLAGAEEQGDL